MTGSRSDYAGGNQEYLRAEQYVDSGRLARRAGLHEKYSTAEIGWFDWLSAHFDLIPDADVLEVGCGAGWVWERSAVAVPQGVSLMLTDFSAGMVDEAVERVTATQRFAAVTGRTADAQFLPFGDSTFDRVIADHMLYHLPDPARGVSELARVVRPNGIVVAATNGRHHMQELAQIRGQVFDLPTVDQTVEVFGADTGFAILRPHFGDIRWLQCNDVLHCTDPTDVLAYVYSTPPGETADADQRSMLEALVRQAFDRGNGTMTITKDTGVFVCRP